MPVRTLLATAAVLFSTAVLAQNNPGATLRGVITSISADGATLGVMSRKGEAATVRLKSNAIVTLVVPAKLGDVKPGAFIGVAAQPGPDGALRAIEVHLFPEAMRGTGEGFRPFDLGPGSSMTNGALSTRVDAVNGQTLTVTYAGGAQTIKLEPGTPIVGFAAGERADLKPGAAIIARGARSEDGAIDATRILVGKDGLVPPM
jgi:hypothetical protein